MEQNLIITDFSKVSKASQSYEGKFSYGLNAKDNGREINVKFLGWVNCTKKTAYPFVNKWFVDNKTAETNPSAFFPKAVGKDDKGRDMILPGFASDYSGMKPNDSLSLVVKQGSFTNAKGDKVTTYQPELVKEEVIA